METHGQICIIAVVRWLTPIFPPVSGHQSAYCQSGQALGDRDYTTHFNTLHIQLPRRNGNELLVGCCHYEQIVETFGGVPWHAVQLRLASHSLSGLLSALSCQHPLAGSIWMYASWMYNGAKTANLRCGALQQAIISTNNPPKDDPRLVVVTSIVTLASCGWATKVAVDTGLPLSKLANQNCTVM